MEYFIYTCKLLVKISRISEVSDNSSKHTLQIGQWKKKFYFPENQEKKVCAEAQNNKKKISLPQMGYYWEDVLAKMKLWSAFQWQWREIFTWTCTTAYFVPQKPLNYHSVQLF